MFISKISTNQEPLSPKVTCIGQIKVKRSNQSTTVTIIADPRRCNWLRRLRKKNLSFFRFNCRVKSEKLQELKQLKREVEDVTFEIDGMILESVPRNVFLLTRSRSAPENTI